ncbi:MAG: 6,7-dimethyl-8-ribityllumazine synthase [Gammaproteobacteria bacterium]|nr:6,7-dimethyl-8-ribityllumazine synthase [Gammaproteobacteria bacterium]
MKAEKNPAAPHYNADIQNARVGIVASRFNGFIVDRLVDGARATLQEQGIRDNAVVFLQVPGAFELPVAVKKLADEGNCEGIIALGAVIRGETAHFDYICSGVTNGLMRVSLDHGLPVGFGLLTVDNEAQALARAGEEDNKGRDAAQAVLEMISLLRRVRQ